MAGMDGYEVCKQLKALPETKDIPVIFATALSDENDETKGFEIGAVDYVIKPISAPIVIARVRNHLELKRYRDYLEQIAFIDGPTAIPNRRRFDEHFQSEWQRGVRREASFTILMIDIDFFKPFNDYYGHQTGGDCLVKVVQALASSVHHPGDLVARYGGEEFVCVLPDTDLAGAEIIANTLRKSVNALKVSHEFSSVTDHATVSIGAAAVKLEQSMKPEELVEKADNNLYEAKETGRDRVVAA
jgi:diguanylate cyclase (GGDEF)-like protein